MAGKARIVIKDKLKHIDLKYFLLPFASLIVLFIALTWMVINNRIQETYKNYRDIAVNTVDSYSYMLAYSHEAYDTITALLDEKLSVASQAIMLNVEKKDNAVLADLAKRFQIDEVYLYDQEGVIRYSNNGKYIGWRAYEGHPVYEFMNSDRELFVEDIRKDTESDLYYKYAYIKNQDGSFIQIGALAEYVHELRGRFEYQQLLSALYTRSDISFIAYLDETFTIHASSDPQYHDLVITDVRVLNQLKTQEFAIDRIEFSGQSVFLATVPISDRSGHEGYLLLTWPTDQVDAEIKSVIGNAFMQMLIVMLFLSAILFYAYRKNKSNIKIAYYDKLTGLPNETYLLEYLDDAVHRFTSVKAIMLLSFKNLGILTATHGSEHTDKMLAYAASAVRQVLEPSDTLFSTSADRFVIMKESYRDIDELKNLAKRVTDIFSQPIDLNTEHQYLNAEIGIAEIKDASVTVDKLLQHVELASTFTKAHSNDAIRFFQDEMDVAIVRQDKIEKALRAIINEKDNDTLALHYQPKLDLRTQKIVGFEALARMRTKELGNVPPLEFIDIAEKRLLIYELSKQILHRACKFINGLAQSEYTDVHVAVNISGMQLLREEFIEDTRIIISSYGIDAHALEFEITESVLLDNFELVNQKLKELKQLGITISLDDFGTGFSSLSTLRDLSLDSVKIDRSFIRNIRNEHDDDSILSDIISMANKIGLTVVAEGVEEEFQKQYLMYHACDILQGYYFCRPIPQQDAIEFMKSQTA